MGRPRNFDQETVLDHAAGLFASSGYAGTSIDDIVTTAGLNRGSLYATFGSKRGLFRAAMLRAVSQQSMQAGDLVVVALLELAPQDPEIRRDCKEAYSALFAADPALLGTHLLIHAGLNADPNGKEPQ